MIIEKIFSNVENPEENLYSVLMTESEMRIFSDEEKRTKLKDYNSHRGLGRSLVLGLGAPGLVGGYVGKKHAEKLDEEGKTDAQIKSGATKRGAIVGAGTGAAIGALTNVLLANKFGGASVGSAVKSGLMTAALGALGGGLGARKNTKERLAKRLENEEIIREALKNKK